MSHMPECDYRGKGCNCDALEAKADLAEAQDLLRRYRKAHDENAQAKCLCAMCEDASIALEGKPR